MKSCISPSMAPIAAGSPTDSTAGAGGNGGGGDAMMVLTRLALASISASLSESATFPIDTVKTRLQLLRRAGGSSSPLRSVFTDILAKGGGLAGFYSGISPAVLRHLLYTPIRIVCYENLRGFAAGGDDGGGEVSLLGKALAGGASGVLAQVVASPADLVKVRMQANSGLYTGIHDAFSKIIKFEGLFGLWRGVAPNAQRAFLVNMGELTCYDHAKHFILSRNICDDNIYAHTLSSMCSGLCASVVSCPADVVKTRMMNPGVTGGTGYRNSFDCLVKTVKGEGVLALWKGFFPTWARLGPWQLVFWVSYEKLRQTFGLSSF